MTCSIFSQFTDEIQCGYVQAELLSVWYLTQNPQNVLRGKNVDIKP